jgi:ribosome-associated toxin RatA of RatAB toxin-antitoxin module
MHVPRLPWILPPLLLMVGALLAAPFAAAANASTTSQACDAAAEQLRAGDVAVIDLPPTDGRGVALRACGTVEAPPGAVWDVLRDCGSFEQFLPRVSRSRLTSRDDTGVVCDETIDLPFPLGDLHSISQVVESSLPSGGFQRRWSLIRGSYRRLEGAWLVLPANAAGSASIVVYELDMDPDVPIPDFMIRYAQATAAPEVFRAVRERVRQCAGGDATACGSR